jgi:oligopeptide/dipeptide ABC transporter ATP-binding protein
VSLTLDRGKVSALVGETGCGKTLTALSLIGLLPPVATLTSGRISLQGMDVVTGSERAWRGVRGRRVAMIPQDPLAALNPVRTIGFQLCEPLTTILKLPKAKALEQAKSLLAQVGIEDADRALQRYPHELSGGMRQRALIAMALACDPAVLLADEPTTAIDVTVQAQILDLIRELTTTRDLAVLLVTHDLAVASQVSDSINVMYAGAIVETGPTASVLHSPVHPYTKGLLACAPRIDVKITPMPTLPGSVASAWTMTDGCRFSPRCGWSVAECVARDPQLVPVATDHSAACWVFAPHVPQSPDHD